MGIILCPHYVLACVCVFSLNLPSSRLILFCIACHFFHLVLMLVCFCLKISEFLFFLCSFLFLYELYSSVSLLRYVSIPNICNSIKYAFEILEYLLSRVCCHNILFPHSCAKLCVYMLQFMIINYFKTKK